MSTEASDSRQLATRDADSLSALLQAAFPIGTAPDACRIIAQAILAAAEAEDDD